jgi:hypothetical protein
LSTLRFVPFVLLLAGLTAAIACGGPTPEAGARRGESEGVATAGKVGNEQGGSEDAGADASDGGFTYGYCYEEYGISSCDPSDSCSTSDGWGVCVSSGN